MTVKYDPKKFISMAQWRRTNFFLKNWPPARAIAFVEKYGLEKAETADTEFLGERGHVPR